MLAELKAEVERLRGEHAFAHRLYEKALGETTVGMYLWLYALAEDLFNDLQRAESRLAQEMERSR